MTTRTISGTQRSVVFAFLLALTASSGVFAQEHGHGGGGFAGNGGPEHRAGYAIEHEHERFWYDRGQWYRRDGLGWLVVGAPLGAFVSDLPPFYATVWFGGVTYYYADDTYYKWSGDHNEYGVGEPPAGIESAGTPQAPAGDAIVIYPKNGQSSEQQGRDRYECHHSAVAQTGYDPTQAGGGVPSGVAAP